MTKEQQAENLLKLLVKKRHGIHFNNKTIHYLEYANQKLEREIRLLEEDYKDLTT